MKQDTHRDNTLTIARPDHRLRARYRFVALPRFLFKVAPLSRKESSMRTYRIAAIAALLPGFLQAQTKPYSEPFSLTPPGIVTRMEKFEALPSSRRMMIVGFAEDQNGYLWCRVNQGMARFDGYDLKVYREDITDTARELRTQVQAIAVDRDGFVWAATPNAGLKRLDPATGQSHWYRGREDDSTSIGTGATTLLVTSDGELWAGGRYGLARYNRKSESFSRYSFPQDYRVPGDFPITSLCENGQSIWAGLAGPSDAGAVGGGILEFNRDTKSWKRFVHNASTGSGPSDDVVTSVCADPTGCLWVGNRAGLDRYDPSTDTWSYFSVSKNGISMSKSGARPVQSLRVQAIAADDFGGIWIGSGGAGLFRIDPATGEVVQYRHNAGDANSIPYDMVNGLHVHRFTQQGESPSTRARPASSIVWIPCGQDGAHRVIVRRNPCTSVVIRHEEGTFSPLISGLSHESSGKIWAGLFNGRIGLFDLQTRKVRWCPDPSGIWGLTRLRDRTLLATTRFFKAWMYDAQRDAFIPFMANLNITCFLEENDSLLWLGCRSGGGITYIAALDRRTGRYTVYPRQDSDSSRYRDELALRMCSDGTGGLWYGTGSRGLIRFDLKQKTYHRYAADPSSDDALISNGVMALIPDSAGKLWVGTDAGLDLMDYERGTFEHIHTSAQRENELFIRDMVDDGEGHLWITTQEAVVCFTKATRAIRMLALPPQVQSANFWGAEFESRSRTLTFGGGGGFFTFSIDDPPPASAPPPVVLTSFKVFEKAYPLEAEIWSLKSITLPHSASFFSFTFAALEYINSAKNKYAYRLEGFDPDWIQTGARRYVSFSNLDPGTYRLRVRAANSEGIWNEQGTAIDIVVLPPWYRTYWAYAAYALLAGSLLYVTWRFDRRRTALKHSLEMKSFEAAKMREVDQLKSAFFTNISHEFRTPLTLILGPIDQLVSRFKDKESQSTLGTMRRSGLRLLQLINQLLDLSRMDAGKMTVQVRLVELVALSRALVMSFLSLAERKKIDLIFDPEEDEINAYADRDKFEKILTNLLSNAFKFTGEGGRVTVTVTQFRYQISDIRIQNAIPPLFHKGGIAVSVADTGIGIPPNELGKVFDRFYQIDSARMQAEGGTGIGLALTKELVELLKGEITVESTPGHGSTFTVRLPIDKEQWRQEEIATEEKEAGCVAASSAAAALIEEEPSQALETLPEPGKPVVLIVEDNADVRKYVRGFLEKHFSVEEAENGKTGLEKAREMGIDLVVSDIMMPVMDGVQLCRELKGDDRTSHIPLILLTARATSEGKLEGLDVGADDYVVKPFDARELVARVKNLIETRRKLWEKYHQQVTLGPSNIQVASADERFLKRLAECIDQHVADVEYDTEALAHDMFMSRMQLNRKLHALTGKSTHEVVREFRLQRAAELLRNHAENIAGVAYDVGFSSLSHFASAFRERFGVVPSGYAANNPPANPATDRRRDN
jgi:signal transduction histidine kinase/DNA-binding response OmpR family regulator/streptogramin lyase